MNGDHDDASMAANEAIAMQMRPCPWKPSMLRWLWVPSFQGIDRLTLLVARPVRANHIQPHVHVELYEGEYFSIDELF